MDYARKIGKSDKPRTWKRTSKQLVTTRDHPLSKDTVFSEDHRLVNWKKWLGDRKKQTRRIEFATGRSHADQLQSSSERFRAFVEMKNLMEHAAIPVPVIGDKYRGGPEFWRTPEFLPDRGNACLPQISLTATRKDLNLPPDLMQVGLPDLIAKERDLIAVKAKKESWERSEYLKTRKLELAEEIALLLPKKPEMATLIVQGRASFQKKKPLLRIPPITISEPEEELFKDADQMIVLKIQDREFVWQKSLFNTKSKDIDSITWSLIFSSEIGKRVEKEIVLENKGNRVIVYYWRNSSFQSNNMSFEIHGSPFFFNKTNGLILPGQIVRIKVWFRHSSRGIFTESWRFVTEPRLSLSAFEFRFWGCSNDTQSAELINYRKIDEYLDRCIRDSAIYSIIKEIITNVEHSESLELADKMQLLQNDLFISQNKYDAAYNALCAFANIFEDESELAKKSSLIEPVISMDVARQKSTPLLQRSNNNLQEAQNEKLIDRSLPIIRVKKEKENSNLKQPYREILFTRIYKALEEAIERACASIDSLNRFNKLNKQEI
ncbi:MYCBP-associated protein-like [Linepithema humile]|uniref:MYCBP-associated protein-like n=1 Tax=Linepithema humile TaxID=83485 RepID=UPI00351E9165